MQDTVFLFAAQIVPDRIRLVPAVVDAMLVDSRMALHFLYHRMRDVAYGRLWVSPDDSSQYFYLLAVASPSATRSAFVCSSPFLLVRGVPSLIHSPVREKSL